MSADNHGNTPAAWTGVSVGMLAFVVAGIGLMLTPINMLVFWIGMAMLPLALVVWQVMERMGMGAHHPAHRDDSADGAAVRTIDGTVDGTVAGTGSTDPHGPARHRVQ